MLWLAKGGPGVVPGWSRVGDPAPRSPYGAKGDDMGLTVLECLMNAQVNFNNVRRMGFRDPIFEIAMKQLNNGIKALGAGRMPDDLIEDSPSSPDEANSG